MSRNDGRMRRSSKPIVAISVRWATGSPDEEIHAGRRFHDETAGVVPLRLELAHVMVHRGLVDAERLRQGGLREVLLAVADQKGEDFPLLRRESLAVADLQERQRDLLVRL